MGLVSIMLLAFLSFCGPLSKWYLTSERRLPLKMSSVDNLSKQYAPRSSWTVSSRSRDFDTGGISRRSLLNMLLK